MTAKAQMVEASGSILSQEELDALALGPNESGDSAEMRAPVGAHEEEVVSDPEFEGDELPPVEDGAVAVDPVAPLDQDGGAVENPETNLASDTAEPAAHPAPDAELPAAPAAVNDGRELDAILNQTDGVEHQAELPAAPDTDGDEQGLDEALGLARVSDHEADLPAAPAAVGDDSGLDAVLEQAGGVDHQVADLADLLGAVPEHLPEAPVTRDGDAGVLPEMKLPEFDGVEERAEDTSPVNGDAVVADTGNPHIEVTDADLSSGRIRPADRVKSFFSGRINAIRGTIDKLKAPANKTNERVRYRDVLSDNKAQIKEKISHAVTAIDAQLSHPAKKKKLRSYAAQITTLLDNVTNEYDVPTPAQLNLLKSKLSLIGVELDFSKGAVVVNEVNQKQIELFMSGLRSDTLAFMGGVLAGGAFSVGATALAMARPESQHMVQAVRQGLFYAGAVGQLHTGAVFLGNRIARSDKRLVKQTGAFVENLGFGIEKTLGTRVGTAFTRGLSLGLMGGSVGIGIVHQNLPTSPWAEHSAVAPEAQPPTAQVETTFSVGDDGFHRFLIDTDGKPGHEFGAGYNPETGQWQVNEGGDWYTVPPDSVSAKIGPEVMELVQAKITPSPLELSLTKQPPTETPPPPMTPPTEEPPTETPAVSPTPSPTPQPTEVPTIAPPQIEQPIFTEELITILNQVPTESIMISDGLATFDNVTLPNGSVADIIVWQDSDGQVFISTVGADSDSLLRPVEMMANKQLISEPELSQVGIKFQGDTNHDGVNEIQVRGQMAQEDNSPTPEPIGTPTPAAQTDAEKGTEKTYLPSIMDTETTDTPQPTDAPAETPAVSESMSWSNFDYTSAEEIGKLDFTHAVVETSINPTVVFVDVDGDGVSDIKVNFNPADDTYAVSDVDGKAMAPWHKASEMPPDLLEKLPEEMRLTPLVAPLIEQSTIDWFDSTVVLDDLLNLEPTNVVINPDTGNLEIIYNDRKFGDQTYDVVVEVDNDGSIVARVYPVNSEMRDEDLIKTMELDKSGLDKQVVNDIDQKIAELKQKIASALTESNGKADEAPPASTSPEDKVYSANWQTGLEKAQEMGLARPNAAADLVKDFGIAFPEERLSDTEVGRLAQFANDTMSNWHPGMPLNSGSPEELVVQLNASPDLSGVDPTNLTDAQQTMLKQIISGETEFELERMVVQPAQATAEESTALPTAATETAAVSGSEDTTELEPVAESVVPAAEALTFDPDTHAATDADGKTVYQIQPGDSRARVSEQFGVTIEALEDANPDIVGRQIHPNELLVIPEVEPVAQVLPALEVQADGTKSAWSIAESLVDSYLDTADHDTLLRPNGVIDVLKDLLAGVHGEKPFIPGNKPILTSEQAENVIETIDRVLIAKFQDGDFEKASQMGELLTRLNLNPEEGQGIAWSELTKGDRAAIELFLEGKTPIDVIKIEGDSTLDKFVPDAKVQEVRTDADSTNATALLKNVQDRYRAEADDFA